MSKNKFLFILAAASLLSLGSCGPVMAKNSAPTSSTPASSEKSASSSSSSASSSSSIALSSSSSDADFTYALNNQGTAYGITAYSGKGGSVEIPSTHEGKPVTSLANELFYTAGGNTTLEEVTIPKSITQIGNGCFGKCSRLRKVTFDPEIALEKIPVACFTGDSLLSEITIPASVKSIGEYVNGELTASGKEVWGPFSHSGLKSVHFADNSALKYITSYAFSCEQLTSITLPASLETIDCYAFLGAGLTSVSFAPNSQLDEILYQAFWNTKITTFTLPSKLKYVGACFIPTDSTITLVNESPNFKLFGSGRYLTDAQGALQFVLYGQDTTFTIPEGVTSIPSKPFLDGWSVAQPFPGSTTSVSFPTSLVSIDEKAFWGFKNLAHADFSLAKSLTSIGSKAFAYSGLTALDLSMVSAALKIETVAFDSCESLTSVSFPSSLTSIGDGAFEGCTALASVSFPSSLTSIAEYAFFGCTALTSVTLPTALTTIGRKAFSKCTSLASVSLPATLTSIGYGAFSSCAKLATMNYAGAKADWAKVSKDDSWHEDCTLLKAVTCSNGDVTL